MGRVCVEGVRKKKKTVPRRQCQDENQGRAEACRQLLRQ